MAQSMHNAKDQETDLPSHEIEAQGPLAALFTALAPWVKICGSVPRLEAAWVEPAFNRDRPFRGISDDIGPHGTEYL